jgi:hypothetical protein
MFVVVALIMQRQRGMHADKLGQLGYPTIAFKSFLCGFSFGSEVFLITGIWSDKPGVAVTILLFRLLHLGGGVVLMGVIFGSEETVQLAEHVLAKAPMLSDDMDHIFARSHVPFVGALMVLTMCDVTMVQYLPWKRSTFYTESEGYPDMSVLKFALGIKSVQTLVSVVCQLSYLVSDADVNDPTMSPDAKALFALNIMFSVSSVVFGTVLLVIKNKVLGTVQKRHDIAVKKMHIPTATGSSGEVQMHDLYGGGNENTGVLGVSSVCDGGGGTANPLHAEKRLHGFREHVGALQMEVDAIKDRIDSLNERKVALAEENVVLLKEKKELSEQLGLSRRGYAQCCTYCTCLIRSLHSYEAKRTPLWLCMKAVH